MTNKPEGMRMKRLFILILALLTALMMASCKKVEEPAVCGRTVQRSTAYRPSTTGRIILAAVIALIIAIAIVHKMQRNSRKRWRLR